MHDMMERLPEKLAAIVSARRRLRVTLLVTEKESLIPLVNSMNMEQIGDMMQVLSKTAIPHATTAMHPAQSWRDGWNDAVDGQPHNPRQYTGDSELLYSDGYACGSVRRRS